MTTERSMAKAEPQPHCFPTLGDASTAADEAVCFQRFDFARGQTTRSPEAEKAEMQAQLARLQAEAEAREQAAYDRGHADGEAAGRDAGRQEIVPVLDRFRQSVSRVAKLRKEIYHNVEQETLALALAIAGRILGQEVTVNPEVVGNAVRSALTKVVSRERIKIRINTLDLQYLQNNLIQFADQVDDIENVVFEADDSITQGGCLIETNFGDIDAKIESQLKAVENSLKDAVQQSPHRS